MRISPLTLAKHTGIPEQTLYQWQRNGIFSECENSDDIFDYIREILVYYRGQLKTAISKKTPGQDELQAEKIRLTREQADKLQLENSIRAGDLIEADQVRKAWQSVLLACKNKLLAIPSGVSAELAFVDDPNRINAVLQARIIEALDELSRLE